MAYSRPDVYIEEILSADQASQGVSTSVAAFFGLAERGPANAPILCNSINDFRRVFGGALADESLFYSVRSFFENGGSSCYAVRLVSGAAIDAGVTAHFHTFTNGASDFLKVEAGYRGTACYGSSYSDVGVEFSLSGRFQSAYVDNTTGDLTADASSGDTEISVASVSGISPNSIIKIAEGASGTPTYHFLIVKGVRSVIESGSLVHKIELTSPLTAAITALDSQITLLEYNMAINKGGESIELFENLSFNLDADNYIETVINDSQVGSRLVVVSDLLTSSTLDNRQLSIVSGETRLSSGGGDELVGFALADIIGDRVARTGLYAISGRDNINLVAVPPSITAGGKIPASMIPTLNSALLTFCGEQMNLFAILDTPAGLTASASGAGSVGEWRKGSLGVDSYWGGLYFPRLKVAKDGVRGDVTVPPSGAVAGLFARVDAAPLPRGSVASSPAGYGVNGEIRGIKGIEVNVADADHGDLNLLGINVMRRVNNTGSGLPGVVTLGARTLSSTSDFRYVNVRRMMTYIEQNVKMLAKPHLFSNNGPQLWATLTDEISSLLSGYFRNGQLAGNSEAEAFFVKIDESINDAESMRNGILNAEIGLALQRPAEFIIFRFSQSASSGATIQE